MSEKYNGWANYETWRVNLEMLDGMGCEDFGVRPDTDNVDASVHQLEDIIEAHVVELVQMDAKGFALDLALSFLSKVDWEEIATHMVEDSISISHSN